MKFILILFAIISFILLGIKQVESENYYYKEFAFKINKRHIISLVALVRKGFKYV